MVEGYIEGAPELIVEVAALSVSYDLHNKLNAYRRNGVREYVVWRVADGAIDVFVLQSGRFEKQSPNADGVLQSTVFPGLWLDAVAMTEGNLTRVLEVLQRGIASAEHNAFVAQINERLAANESGK